MGEVLRAILDKNSAYNKPAFYTGQIVTVSTITGSKTFARREVSIACKMDTYFLAMGAAQFAVFQSAGAQGLSPRSEATTFMVTRGSNREAFAISPQVKSNLNFNLNNFVAWDEYVLFEPGELITFTADVQLTDVAAIMTHTTMIVLMGVEYKMRAKGAPNNG